MKSVDKIIKDSMNRVSSLDERILSIDGMSSTWGRHLLNNLIQDNYLEIGVWHGSTFVSAMYGKSFNSYAIDNFCQYNENESRINFLENCELFGIKGFKFIEQDAFSVDLNEIPVKIKYYFYDGNHTHESTTKALTYYYPVLAEKFMFIADDYSWNEVRIGVQNGINECNLKILKSWEVKSEDNNKDAWWNGMGLFLLKK